MKKFIKIIDSDFTTKLEVKSVDLKTISKVFFDSLPIDYDFYLLQTKNIELYFLENDHAEITKPHFCYNNGPNATNINLVHGRAVVVYDATSRAEVSKILKKSKELLKQMEGK